MSTRLKAVVSAYACSPVAGSEGGVGWGVVQALAKHHDLWVIVEEEKFREDIERALRERPERGEGIHFHFLRKERHRLSRRVWPPSYYWYYRRWARDASRLALELHRHVRFDVAHQLTMVGYREPGYLWTLGIPFVWGPVGGLGHFPWRFLGAVGAGGAVFYAGYNVVNALQSRLLRRPRAAARAAAGGLIAATPEQARCALARWRCPSTVLPEVGLPAGGIAAASSARSPREPLRIVWSGLHVPRKALNLGLRALSRLPPDARWQLDVLGEGPLTERWKRLSRRLGLAPRCRFHGWLPRDLALDVTRRAHVVLITSLRDLTSTVTVEALALGVPIVCLDHCGFEYAVDASCEIRVPVSTPRLAVRELARALGTLERDESLRSRLAAGALRRAQVFSWDRKAEVISALYAESARLAEAPGKPGPYVNALFVHAAEPR